ncbi:hypothetical protein COJ46_01685 [Bacillus sp. AFS077874]|uniref:RHS repeat-associated core domain-containing protein n=1 Tax=unclassified Bacillus (in: firmicutes) TaxID=185979 RepID=UPI000BEC15EA|nr:MULTISPECIES: RHS repeat-associated core domain-containing protein [unclassified Bacillus (in: firmicutes)]PEC50950.1 hypothetical protein CON00_04355 [Bacillus sp. AFS096315]PFM83258.1 hypothetical protein COJ46_01685 [Bacillus sp. AFS077874]
MGKKSSWYQSSLQRRINKLVVSVFAASSVLYAIPPSNHSMIGTKRTFAATTGVADKPNLGQESYWNFYSTDLSSGWSSQVNTATGNLVINKSLVTIDGRALPLSEGLTYNATTQQNVGVGLGWTLENGFFLQENADGSVTWKDGDATNHIFTKNGDGTYSSPSGKHLTLTKLQAGIFTIQDKDQSVSRFENGRLVSITDAKQNTESYTYDTDGNLSKVTDPSGRNLLYAYDTNKRLDNITDPSNHKFQFSYDTSGKLIGVTDSQNNKVQFEYDTSNRLKTFIDAKGQKTTFNYDTQSRIVKLIDARSNTTTTYETNFAYNDTTHTTTITDPAGKINTFVHNTLNNLTQYKDGANNIFNYDWNQNEMVTSTDSKGSTSFQYDSKGNTTQVTGTISTGNTATTTMKYDSKNNPTEVTNANQNTQVARYDENSNQISNVNIQRQEADGKTFDANGKVTSSTDLGAPTYNLIENGNLERLDTSGNLIGWNKGGNTASISVDSTVSSYGSKSVRISNAASTTAYLYSNGAQVTAGTKLTLSAFGRIQNVSGTGGANVGIEFYDSNWNYLGSSYSNNVRGNGNKEYTVTATAPTNSAYALAVVELDQASGTVWFDSIQLEKPIKTDEGHILTDFNMIENSSFEWGGSLWLTSTSNPATITTEAAWADSYSAKLNLPSVGDSWIGSTDIPVKPGEPLTLSGFVKTNNLTGSGARIEVNYFDSTGAYLDYATTNFQKGTQDFTRYAVSTTPPANAAIARVYGTVWSSTGTAYFDNMRLTTSGTTLYGYDSSGNYLTSTQDADGNLTQFSYDGVGNQTSMTDPMGYKTNFTYDGNNNLTSVTDPKLKITRYEYDPSNLHVTIRDARSSSSTDNTYKTTFGYNELNQITSMTDPLGKVTSHTYDNVGNEDSTIYPNGNKVQYTYDNANRLNKKSYIGSTEYWNYSYDVANNLTQVTDNQSRSYNFSYDGINRLTSYTNLFGYSTNYQLDKVGNILSSTDSKNKTISYSYGSDNRLLSLTDPSGKVTKYNYNESGLPFEIIRGNGLKSEQTYDKLGRITEIADPGNPNGSVYDYDYDKNGNITNIYGYNGAQAFSYDELNRLTSWTDEAGTVTSYQYDAVGNLTKKGSQTFTYNAANQITNTGFTYDVNGNLTKDSKFNYFYNYENQLIKVTKVSDGSTIATYTYDYRGLRTSKTTPSGGTIYYHWDDQGRLVRESDTNGNTLSLYIYNGNDLVAVEKGGLMYYVHTNHRGDILGVTDVNGNQVATYNYGPWGELLSKTGTVDIPFRYAGYYYDQETGLYYLKARYYSPDLGRFLTKDQIEYGELKNPTTLNLYAYANNNPVMNVDPNGTHSISRSLVAFAIDTLVGLTPLGAAYVPLKFLYGAAAKALVKKLAPKIAGAASWLLTKAIGGAFSFSTNSLLNFIYDNLSSFLSIGGGLALFADWKDGKIDGRIHY